MKDTYKVDFVHGSSWPIQFIITIRQRSLHCNITAEQARCLAILFKKREDSNVSLKFLSEQNWEHCVNWLSDDSVQIVSQPLKVLSVLQTILTAKMAKDLSHDIRTLLLKSSVPQQKCIIAPDVNPLAGAKRRMNDNLRSIFE